MKIQFQLRKSPLGRLMLTCSATLQKDKKFKSASAAHCSQTPERGYYSKDVHLISNVWPPSPLQGKGVEYKYDNEAQVCQTTGFEPLQSEA
ncbi:hypothetical protein CEXT_217951 [Caerostris extrusa]|uniref:Uncharacterized protein n=1 Tax=Caerostris extrusa TaxID=172846 RepID=A0AAV4XVZ7_CAEEX|nr:hypothetical protein CEXT_217951 [Caerostris extrusa]